MKNLTIFGIFFFHFKEEIYYQNSSIRKYFYQNYQTISEVSSVSDCSESFRVQSIRQKNTLLKRRTVQKNLTNSKMNISGITFICACLCSFELFANIIKNFRVFFCLYFPYSFLCFLKKIRFNIKKKYSELHALTLNQNITLCKLVTNCSKLERRLFDYQK